MTEIQGRGWHRGVVRLGPVLVGFIALSGQEWAYSGDRINQEGRILGSVQVVTNATLFNTSQADSALSSMQIFPVTNPWNEDISRRPVLVNSDAMIAQINSDLQATRRTLRAFQEMNFVLVPDSQALVPITFVDYPSESDPSPYPIPSNLPIETWPTGTGSLTMQQWQQDTTSLGGDRHGIIVQPGNGFIWEMWQTKLVSGTWQASNGAKFDIKSNNLRPVGWTSADAAGLPMFQALPRFDECERGMVEHACRIVVAKSRREYIYPATHFASTTSATQTNVPAMGQRLRLKAAFNIPTNWTRQEKSILLGLKKYGAIVADNGGFLSISITPDNRWPAGAFDHLSTIGITNFEVIQTTGPTEGPRSASAPRADAGSDFSASIGSSPALQGVVSFSGSAPRIQWRCYSGPGTVVFGNPAQTNTTASFSAPGLYTLMLSADDSIHAVAYDAVTVIVTDSITLVATRSGPDVQLSWQGGNPPFTIESSSNGWNQSWTGLVTTSNRMVVVPGTNSPRLFRLRAGL